MIRAALLVALVVMVSVGCSESPGRKGLAAALSMTAPSATPSTPAATAAVTVTDPR